MTWTIAKAAHAVKRKLLKDISNFDWLRIGQNIEKTILFTLSEIFRQRFGVSALARR
jgi:hypothetical protein